MARPRTGSVEVTKQGYIYARVRFKDSSRKSQDIRIPAGSKTEAHERLRELVSEVKANESGILARRKTFDWVASEYIRVRLVPAVIINNVKVAGVRSIATPKLVVKRLIGYFGNKPIQSFTRRDVEEYKMHRLETPVYQGRPRTIRSVNSDLSILRQILYFAAENGWLSKPPRPLFLRMISPSAENRRSRLLSGEEESRLLLACEKPRRRHLRLLIVAALDTCQRRGALLQLRWKDIYFDTNIIQVLGPTTKTLRPVTLKMTDRLRTELLKWFQLSDRNPDSLLFGIESFKTAFKSACRDAEIEGLTFHDLRATGICKLIRAGVPEEFVRRITGHTTSRILQENYIRINEEIAEEIATTLNKVIALSCP